VNEPSRPLPRPTPDTLRYWEGCKQHELWLPFCLTCKEYYFYPRAFCPRCFGSEIEWRRASGRGKLYTFSIQYRPQAPGFKPPYVTAIVQLDEGPRVMTNLIDVEPEPDNIRCDMQVEVVFQDMSDEITLPMFRPAGGPA
jgi:uncharacterized OB-fold protein